MPSPLETGNTAPTSLAHLIGQRQVIRQVEVALDAAQMDGRRFDHALLVGPPGLGKSAVAQVIACEMAGGFHETLGQSLKAPSDLNALLLGAKDKDVVFIDEAHELREGISNGTLSRPRQASLVHPWSKWQTARNSDRRFHAADCHDGRILPAAAATRSNETAAAVRVLLGRGTGRRSSPQNPSLAMDC